MRKLKDVDVLPEADGELVDAEENDERKELLRTPGDPTSEGFESHREGHLPYRSWCPHCLNGKATGRQHRPQTKEQRILQLGFDYPSSAWHGMTRIGHW